MTTIGTAANARQRVLEALAAAEDYTTADYAIFDFLREVGYADVVEARLAVGDNASLDFWRKERAELSRRLAEVSARIAKLGGP